MVGMNGYDALEGIKGGYREEARGAQSVMNMHQQEKRGETNDGGQKKEKEEEEIVQHTDFHLEK